MKKIIAHLKENWIKYGFETLVITAGIILAFGLNNWNEGRKEKIVEREFLIDIRNSLQTLGNDYQRELLSIKQALEDNEAILRVIDEDLPYSNSLDTAFVNLFTCSSLWVDYGAYESLKANGLKTITNESLRNWITLAYGRILPNFTSNEEAHCDILKDIYIPSSMWVSGDSENTPIDFEKLRKDVLFNWLIRKNISFHKQAYELRKFFLPQVHERINIFDKEIARLEGQ